MPKIRTLDVRTTVVSASYPAFKTGITKVISGVTYKHYKSKGSAFYQMKSFNDVVTEEFCRQLHQFILSFVQQESNPNELSVTTSFTIKWSDVGRIEDLYNIKMSIFKNQGDITVEGTEIKRVTDKLHIDFFYLDLDTSSPKVRAILDKLEENYAGNIDISRFDLSKSKDKATKLGVTRAPSVVINGEPPALEDPNETQLMKKIDETLKPIVTLKHPEFNPISTPEPTLKK